MPKRTSLLLGIAFIVPGILFLAPIFFHDFSEGSAVGPFFGICLGLTFLIVGIRLTAKFYEIDEAKTNLLSDASHQNNKQLNLANPEETATGPKNENISTSFINYEVDETKAKLPCNSSQQNNSQQNLANPENAVIDLQSENKPTHFIKYVALSPILALFLYFALAGGCELLGRGFGVSCDGNSLIETAAYFGFFGWFISLPLAGMLKLIAWSGK